MLGIVRIASRGLITTDDEVSDHWWGTLVNKASWVGTAPWIFDNGIDGSNNNKRGAKTSCNLVLGKIVFLEKKVNKKSPINPNLITKLSK